MATIAVFMKIDAGRVAGSLQEASEKLNGRKGKTILDFSMVQRIDAEGLRAMAALVALAEDKAMSIGLRGVNVEIYKVLKLSRLAPRFLFLP